MTVSPQGGNGCNGSNENQSRLGRQLEWSRRIGIDELKRIYGASLFLRCTAYLFFIPAVLLSCMTLSIALADKIPELRLYPEWTLPLPVVLIAAHCLKKLKMPSPCRKIISTFQIVLVIAAGYFIFDFVIRGLVIPLYERFRSDFSFWGLGFHCRSFLKAAFLLLLLKMFFDVLWNSRSRQIRFGLFVLSLSWGIIGGIFFHPVYAVAAGVLMAGVFWITVFSKVRHQLFRDDALTHDQLYAVLKQKQRNVPEHDLVLEADRGDISRRKFRRGSVLYFLTVLFVAVFWIFATPNGWFIRQAAELGVAKAQFSLAQGYFCGIGVERNETESVKWYRRAAEQGIAEAQFILGMRYAAGRGVRQDYAEAVKWYRKSADHDIASLKKQYCTMTVLNLAEKYIMMDEYDRAIAYLDDSRLQQDQNDHVRCLRAYLKACVLLAKGQSAEEEIREFDQVFPRYKSSYSGWNVTAFRIWLKNAALSDSARKTIAEMTNRVDYGR